MSPHEEPCGLGLVLINSRVIFFLRLACMKVGSLWRLVFHVIGTDGHPAPRAETDTRVLLISVKSNSLV